MDECAEMVCFLLQFLAAPAEGQVAFCGDDLPEHASDLLMRPGFPEDDERRYAIYQVEQIGNPLTLLARQLHDYSPIFWSLPENTLPEDEYLLDEILCLLELMIYFHDNHRAYNRFWGKNALRESREWRLVRRLAHLALTKLDWPVGLPATTFGTILHC